jgi:hypothetical protein
MIEPVTRDVQIAIVAVGLQTLEAKKAVIRAGDQSGDLGSSNFDQTPVRGNDCYPGTGPVDLHDAKVSSMGFMSGKFRE